MAILTNSNHQHNGMEGTKKNLDTTMGNLIKSRHKIFYLFYLYWLDSFLDKNIKKVLKQM
jgi:hypothetical protein